MAPDRPDVFRKPRGGLAGLCDCRSRPVACLVGSHDQFAVDRRAELDLRLMIKNPVMFVVEIVAALTTVTFLRDLPTRGEHPDFSFQIVLWLWFTVLFANLAEAVAEDRGNAQAESLRKTAPSEDRSRSGRPQYVLTETKIRYRLKAGD